jgi:hypothetical protein
MPSPGILRHVALVRSDVSTERIASINRVNRSSELETTSAVANNSTSLLPVTANVTPTSPIVFTLMMEVLTQATSQKTALFVRNEFPATITWKTVLD